MNPIRTESLTQSRLIRLLDGTQPRWHWAIQGSVPQYQFCVLFSKIKIFPKLCLSRLSSCSKGWIHLSWFKTGFPYGCSTSLRSLKGKLIVFIKQAAVITYDPKFQDIESLQRITETRQSWQSVNWVTDETAEPILSATDRTFKWSLSSVNMWTNVRFFFYFYFLRREITTLNYSQIDSVTF